MSLLSAIYEAFSRLAKTIKGNIVTINGKLFLKVRHSQNSNAQTVLMV